MGKKQLLNGEIKKPVSSNQKEKVLPVFMGVKKIEKWSWLKNNNKKNICKIKSILKGSWGEKN